MLDNVKNQIKELAKNAVFIAEKELGSGKGREKKDMAVNYVVKHLPFPEIIKPLLAKLLSRFIDDVVELSVTYMKSLQSSEGE